VGHALDRFVEAQDQGATLGHALEEMRRGRKTTHWMWFVFPQVAGLGQSPASRHFAISSLEEARAYLGHPVLGPRLAECAAVLVAKFDEAGQAPSALGIFGAVDARKLRSSMTLFMRAAPEQAVFRQMLDLYFDGRPDPLTDEILAGLAGPAGV